MVDNASSEKRKRGVVLSFQGWQRLQSAEQLAAVQNNDGNPYTLEQLSHQTGLSPNTLTKVRRRQKPVDLATLEAYFQTFKLALEPIDFISPEGGAQAIVVTHAQDTPLMGPLPLGSHFYVYRPPIEQHCFKEILNPGALIRIKAPHQMGKTSMLTQILAYGQDLGFRVVVVNLRMVEHQLLANGEQFLQWFCAVVTRALGLNNELMTRWDKTFGANYTCTDYFETYLLPHSDRPLLLMIDGLEELFFHAPVATDFLGLLRVWHEQGRYGVNQDLWQQLRIVLTHSMEAWLPLSLHQSPFNVGLSIELPRFTLQQTRELASHYELDLTTTDALQLQQLVGGHPYLTQLSLFHVSQGLELPALVTQAIAYDSIYSDHLRGQLEVMASEPALIAAMTQVAATPEGVKLPPQRAFQLQGLGLVTFAYQQAIASCELYRQYFASLAKP